MKKVFLILLISCVFLLLARPINASPIINEVYPKPNTDEKEWIEIFNDSEESVDLLEWIIMDELSSPTIIYEFNQESNAQSIEALSFIVIELPTNKLNNSADIIKLINQNGEIIDQLEYVDSQSEMSFSLVKNSDQENSEIILTTPTKGTVNLINDPANDEDDQDNQNAQDEIETYPNLIISEVMACPESNDSEWIKIKNSNNEPVSLKNWQAKDAANNQIMLPWSETIPELDFITVFLTNNLLNNSGDTISLFDPNGKLINEFIYNNCSMGISLTIESASIDTTATTTNSKATQDKSTDTNSNDQEKGKVLGESSQTNQESETNLDKTKKINSLLKITNTDKSSTMKTNNYISKQIMIKHKNLPKYAVISVIIGGMILASSGLFSINISKDEKS